MDIGLRGAPRAQQPAPVRSEGLRAGGRLTAAVVLLLVLVVTAAMAWLLLSALTARPAVTPAATAFATRAFAINRFGYDAARLAWYDGGLAALQVAGYETITGALRRAATAVTAAREATSIAAVLTAVALTVGARRLRLSAPAVVAVPVLFGLLPAALVLHRTADPTQLGVLWACVALALAGGGARRIGATVACGAYLALAVATSPLVLIALVPLFAMLVWSGSLGRLDRPARIATATVGLLLVGLLVTLAATDNLPGGAATVPDLGPLDWAVAVAAVGAAIGGLWVGWLRPLAVALLATGLAAAVSPELRGSLLLVALPLGAVVLPAAVESAVAALDRRQEPWLLGRAVIVGALAIAVVIAWIRRPHGPRAGRRIPAACRHQRPGVGVRHLPSHPKLVVDEAMWACLVKSGYPAEQLAATGGIGPDRASWAWVDARYAIGRDTAMVGAADPVGAAHANSTPVASFGDGLDTIAVRRVVPDAGATATAQREEAGRVAAGRALAGNPRLGLQTRATTVLRAGRVDSRALAVLAAMTGQHSLQIVDFPVVPGENAAAPRRLIAVGTVDDQPVAAGSTTLTMLDQWLRAQQPPYRPASAELSQLEGSPVLLIRYDALGSTGLLPP